MREPIELHHCRLNGRPRPLIDESPRGYLLRLTEANGFKSVSNLVYRLGHSGGIVRFRPESKAGRALLVTLSRSLQYDITLLRQLLTPDAYQFKTNKQSRYLNSVFLQHARVCPLCIAESSVVPRSWDFAMTVVCPTHDVMMIDICPECGQRLSLNRAKLGESPCCRADLSSSPQVKANSSPALKYSMSRVKDGDMAFLAAWSAAVGRLQNPLSHDLPLPEITRIPAAQAMPWVEAAAQLLCSDTEREHYRRFLRNARSDCQFLAVEVAEFPFHLFQQEFGTYFVDLLQGVVTEHVLNCLGGGIPLHQTMETFPAKSLAEILGCPISALSKLEKNGYIHSIAEGVPRRFDIGDLIDVLRKIPSKSDAPNNHAFVAISKLLASKLHLRFGLTEADILLSVINGDIDVSKWDLNTSTVSRQVSERYVYDDLHRIWATRNEVISLFRLAKALNVTTRNLMELSQFGMGWAVMDSHNRQPGQQLLVPAEWTKFRDEYIVLNRVCFFSGAKLNRTKNELSENGVNACIEIGASSMPMLLYSLKDIDADWLLDTVQASSKYSTRYDGYRVTQPER